MSKIKINGRTLQIVTLDFETYYDSKYSLRSKSLNMSEYVRHENFKAHLVGIKIGDGKTRWYPEKKIRAALLKIDWSKSALLAHNTPFDAFICSHHYGIKPAMYLDTLSMARACVPQHVPKNLDTLAKMFGLSGKVKKQALENISGIRDLSPEQEQYLGEYCVDDVNDTYELFFKMYDHIPDPELQLIDLTVSMFADPILELDEDRVTRELEREVGEKTAALLACGVTPDVLSSSAKFADALRSLGVSPPMKISPVTLQQTYAFAKDDLGFRALMNHEDQRVRDLVQARLKVKSTIGETRAKRLLQAGRDGMKIPVLLHYCGAHTTRWSGGNRMNLQNLTRGGELRKSLLAPKGFVVVVADSAQIEARILAWLAEEELLVEAFRNNEDAYSAFASVVYNREVDRKKPAVNDRGQYLDELGNVVETKEEAYYPDFLPGFVGKVCVLGLGYGMGAERLQDTLAKGAMGGPVINLSRDDCFNLVNTYRTRHPRITRLWKVMQSIIEAMYSGNPGSYRCLEYGEGYIRLPNGLFLHYPGLYGAFGVSTHSEFSFRSRNGRSRIYGGLLTENVVQALARCVIAEQMLKVRDLGYRIVTMTHDEIVFVAPEEDADKALEDVLRIMRTPPEWAPDLPLNAEGGYAREYSK